MLRARSRRTVRPEPGALRARLQEGCVQESPGRAGQGYGLDTAPYRVPGSHLGKGSWKDHTPSAQSCSYKREGRKCTREKEV